MPSDKSRPVMFARQAAELDYAFERNGWTPDDVKWLSTGDNLARILEVRRGSAEIKSVEHVIDCDADPFIPEGWRVEEHKKSGSFKWDPKQVQFYLSELQRKGKPIKGNKLRKELAGKPVLNANVLDYLLKHPHLIPEEWKEKTNGYTTYIFFWGTIYRGPYGYLYVRSLCWYGGGWSWGYDWLGHDWHADYPAALRASVT